MKVFLMPEVLPLRHHGQNQDPCRLFYPSRVLVQGMLLGAQKLLSPSNTPCT